MALSLRGQSSEVTDVVNIEKARLATAVRRGFRNWKSQFNEDFGLETHLSDISSKTLAFLAQGKGNSTFYLYDLIMNLENMGSGFQFNELDPKGKMAVVDRYLILLDRIRFEAMKRLGWLFSYPGEELTLVEMLVQFDQVAPGLQAGIPLLSADHPAYEHFSTVSAFEKEGVIRKLIPEALKEIQDHSTTL